MPHVSFGDGSEDILFKTQEWSDFRKQMPRGYLSAARQVEKDLREQLGGDIHVQSSVTCERVLLALNEHLLQAEWERDSKQVSDQRLFNLMFSLVEVYSKFSAFGDISGCPDQSGPWKEADDRAFRAQSLMADIADELRRLLLLPAETLGFKEDAHKRKTESQRYLKSWKMYLELTNERRQTTYTFNFTEEAAPPMSEETHPEELDLEDGEGEATQLSEDLFSEDLQNQINFADQFLQEEPPTVADTPEIYPGTDDPIVRKRLLADDSRSPSKMHALEGGQWTLTPETACKKPRTSPDFSALPSTAQSEGMLWQAVVHAPQASASKAD